MIYFVDSSALLKMYHQERGTEKMRAMHGGSETIYISELARLELMASAALKRRLGHIDTEFFESLVTRFSEDVRGRINVLPFTPSVIADAYQFLIESHETVSLKTLDALQFSFYRRGCRPNSVFVSSDQRLLGVVRSYGFPVLNPETS